MQFVFNLLLEFFVIDLTLSLQVEPVHVGTHRAVTDLLDQVFNLLEKALDVIASFDLVILVHLLSLGVHVQVLFTSVNQVELNVKVEVIKVVFLRVNQLTLVVDEVVLGVEELLTFVMDVQWELIVTVSTIA